MRRRLVVSGIAICLAIAAAVGARLLTAARTPTVPVLIYHDVLDAPRETREWLASNAPVLSPREFESNLAWLERNGYTSVTLDQVAAFAQGRGRMPPKPVAITFDDGWEGVYRYAFPLLAKHHFKATVFLIAGRVQDPARRKPFGTDRLTMLDWDQVRAMESSGLVRFESHTFDLHRLSPKDAAPPVTPLALAHLRVDGELETDTTYKKRLAADFRSTDRLFRRQLGRKPRYLAWPFGAYSPESVAAARASGYRALFTTDYGVVGGGDSLLDLRRVSLSEYGTPNIAGAIAEARYAPEIYSLKQMVKALIGVRNDP